MIVPPAIPGMTTGETTIAFINAIKNGDHIYAQIYGIEKNTIASLVTLTEEDILSGDGITITNILNPDSDLVYGKAVSREIKFRVMKSAKTDMIDWKKPIIIQFGLNINGTVYYATVCRTYGNEPLQITNNGVAVLEYVGYDEMSLYDRIADDFASSLTFPMYMYELIEALATHLGIQLFYSGSNQGKIITGNPFPTKCTYRQIFSWIAEFLGTYCVTEGDIGFRFKNYSDLLYNIDYTLTPDDYYTITKNEIEIHSLPAVQYINTIDNSKNASYPSSYSGIPYQIIDNPIFEKLQDASQVEDALQKLLENHLTFGDSDPTKKRYFPMKVEAIGNFLLEAGDIINVEDLNGNVCPLRIFSKIFTWNGGCTDIYECTGNNVRQIITNGEIQAEYINEVVSNRIANCEKKVLLWQNSSSSAFNAQTLNIDFTGYDGFEVYTLHGHGKQMFDAQKWIVTYYVNGLGNNSFYTCARTFTVANDMKSLAVSNCGYTYRDGGAGINNSLHVPMLIYGIKLG